LRCAIVNVGDNAWNLVAAVYWTLVGVGQEATAREYLDQGYEWICTCVADGQKLIEAMGVDTSNENAQYSNACSETAAVAQQDAETQRERDKQAELDAIAEAERIAEEEAQADLARELLVGKTAAELETA
jgi:allantoicase